MQDITVRTLDEGTTTIDGAAVEALAGELRGDIVTAASPDYDEVRAIWNAMIDRKPAIIARCMGTVDVKRAVLFAREHGLLTSVRGGGHNIAGNSIGDDVFMIDLSPMKWVNVDAETNTVRVGPGASLGDLDRETQEYGLAVPVGINSTTGIAGLTLGGGFGWLTRKYGLTIDSLQSAEVVTADGEIIRADADTNPDLFWAIRGGGGNFGIVTSFEFRSHEVGPEVFAGLIVYPYAEAEAVLQGYRAAVADNPEELSVWVVMRKAPPLPFLPEEVHGKEVVVLALVHNGDMGQAQQDVARFTELGTVVGQHVGPTPFVGFQAAFDPLLTPGARNYWKTHDFSELSDGLLSTLNEAVGKLPSPHCEVFIAHLGGAMARVATEDTAYAGREAEFVMNVHGRWEDAGDDDACIGWARELFADAAPHAMGTAYVNFLTADEQERVASAYGRNFDRLLKVKAEYDPANFFRINQNVRRVTPSA
ncbi:MAG: FAD-binding oxidoreductase [Acidobacteriota bacterium]|jgi:FAD/FMN-containing dehydrogenase